MSDRQRGRGIGLVTLAAAVAAALVAVAVASASGTRQAQAACGDVVLNENSWVGSTANVYVVKNVLEKRLKCKVKVTNITEGQPAFQAMADGKIDVVLEDWDNTLVAVEQEVRDEQGPSFRSAATESPASLAGTSRATCSSSTRSSRPGRV